MSVLDASAILHLLLKRKGFQQIYALADGSIASAITLHELMGRMWKYAQHPYATVRALEDLPTQWVPFDADQALTAIELRGKVTPPGLTLGEAACLGLALTRKLPAVTTDPGWLSLDLGVRVHLIR